MLKARRASFVFAGPVSRFTDSHFTEMEDTTWPKTR
jgi:hypothetical protein